ncbi:HEAT repeat domain-containing protein [Streptomyces tanashiensis]|uniref:HEAT repeat domain-containing protein n=1 Tax=Streptomyces tanashiensis TaxID=67367 RepID=A0ABY6RAM5_9ACTN|nr:HEAT repeat domain-containing protein [Streptomyces tanashiensis]UZX26229.1 HEAT repeat domain-containing protein [Streptomyces tanashiensis]
MALDAVEAIRRLQDRSSAKRRSAAKRLRKLGDSSAGPALLEALKNEVRDSRTWETQYQMTMALGTCGSPSDLPYLRDLVLRRETLHAVHTAGGDAIVRLSSMEHSHTEAIRWCLSTGDEILVGGALQAVAMLRLALDQEIVSDILDFIEARSPQEGIYFWPAVAAAGWTGQRVRQFLTECLSSPRSDVAEAATNSLAGNYGTYRPL